MMIARRLLIKLFISLGLAILIFTFGFFPTLVQKYYSTGFYPYISSALRFISSIFPFAIGDIIYALLIGFVFYKIFRFYKQRKSLKKTDRIFVPLQVLNFFLVLYIIFKIVWGLNYSRPSVSEELGIGNEKYNLKELVLLGDYFVQKTNNLKLKQGKIPAYTIKELEVKSSEAYSLMLQKNQLFRYQNPCLKSVLNAWIISKIGIEGYYAPLSGEANMNMNLPDFVKPYVSCHEIGHQLGIAYEDEANLLGYLTASNSSDVNYQYSANYEMLRYILFEIRMKSPDDYKILYSKILPQVLADFKTEKEFWRKYNGDMFGYMDAAFDSFLKLNNQKKGIDSYQDIVIWLWNIHKKELTVAN
ncbi:zinc-binding protein [Pedobacter sp. Leaf216]|nr:zinc-binding protein [Pedobacter sp. Leaf216]